MQQEKLLSDFHKLHNTLYSSGKETTCLEIVTSAEPINQLSLYRNINSDNIRMVAHVNQKSKQSRYNISSDLDRKRCEAVQSQ